MTKVLRLCYYQSLEFMSIRQQVKSSIIPYEGSKRYIAKELIKHFPKHHTYIEPFAGGLGLYLNKPLAKVNVLNDINSNVINLFMVCQDPRLSMEFEDIIETIPRCQTLYDYYVQYTKDDFFFDDTRGAGEDDAELVKRAVGFWIKLNWSLMRRGSNFCNSPSTHTSNLTDVAKVKAFLANEYIKVPVFYNLGYKEFLDAIVFANASKNKQVKNGEKLCKTKEQAFIYCDPPYLNTEAKLYGKHWKPQDAEELFATLVDYGVRFAISECCKHPIIDTLIEKHNLNKIQIDTTGDAGSSTNPRNEYLITNYKIAQQMLF